MEEEKKVVTTEEKEEKIFVDNKDEIIDEKNIRAFAPGHFYFPGPIISKEDTLKKINEARSTFYLFVDRSNKVKKITLFSFLGIFLIFTILLLANQSLVNVLFVPMILFFVLFLVVVYFLTTINKKKRNVAFDQYRYDYCLLFDTYCFYQTGISNLEFSYNTQIEKEKISNISCYENIIKTLTRDVVKGTMFGVKFTSYDALVRCGEEGSDRKNQSVIFSGKMFHFYLKTKKDEKMYLYLKGCGDSQPTELSGLDKINLSGLKSEYLVYSSVDNPTMLLNKTSIECLNKFKIDDVIEDVIISISSNGIYIGLSLTTKYMTIPFKDEVDDKFINHFKEDIELIKTLIASLMNNRKLTKIESQVEETN